MLSSANGLAAAPTASGGGSWYRLEGGFAGSLGSGSFNETKSGTTYENTLYSYSAGGMFHAGLRLTSVSIGVAGAVEVVTGSLGRRTAATVGSNPTYDYQFLQSLAGGFIGVTLWGDANGPELYGEYYGVAYSDAAKDKTVTSSPIQPNDVMNGTGWGAGLTFAWNPKLRVGLLYRNITYDKLNLSGTPDPVTRTNLVSQQGLITFTSRL